MREPSSKPGMPNERMRRVNSIVREVVASEVELLKDPRLGLVTITGVDTSPDLRHATVYFSVLDLSMFLPTEEALNGAAARVRRAMGRQVRLKYTPALRFLLDPGVAGGEHIDRLLREITQDGQPDHRDHRDQHDQYRPEDLDEDDVGHT